MRKSLVGAFRAPIAAQIVALMVAGLIAGQAVNLLIILLMPAQRPALYRLDEIAAGLQGTSLQPRFGRPLIRQAASEPPRDEQPGRPADRARRELATVLGLPESAVRLSMVGPPSLGHGGAWPGPPRRGGTTRLSSSSDDDG